MFINIASAEIINPIEAVEKIIVVNPTEDPACLSLKKKLNKCQPESVSTIHHAGEYKVAFNRECLNIDATFKFFDRARGIFTFKGKKLGNGFIPIYKIHFKIEDNLMLCW